jgi:hypothetical protein
MSTAAAGASAARARTAPGSRPERPSLRLVPPRRFRPPRTPFVVLVIGLLAVGLVALLLLNTVIAKNSFRLQVLQQHTASLQLQQQALRVQVDSYASPPNLAQSARELGMVPAGTPAFIQLPSGKVLGRPGPAEPTTIARIAGVGPGSAESPSANAGKFG